MKLHEMKTARLMRADGISIKEIAKKLQVSKASVSIWVRDVVLSTEQIDQLHGQPYSRKAVEKRRTARLKNEETKRRVVVDRARLQIKKLSNRELFLVGVALYWGEGTKMKRGVVEFTNSDPEMIKVMMEFFRKVCIIPESKFRGHVFLHEHLSVSDAVSYWSDISSIPIAQFHKTSVQHNKKKVKKDTLPYGTFAVIVCDTERKLTMNGWIKGLTEGIVA